MVTALAQSSSGCSRSSGRLGACIVMSPPGCWPSLARGPGSAEIPMPDGLGARRLGNLRWRARRQDHPHESAAVRRRVVRGQQPFAIVLACVDSRVPPELVFDQGLGDLLTVRSAGEVLDEAVLGSISYGVLELRIPLVLVLADQIRPSIDHGQSGEARVDATINAHVRNVRRRLAAEPDLAGEVATGELAVLAARYELRDQHVRSLAWRWCRVRARPGRASDRDGPRFTTVRR
ncbi:carbonic anhydrase [Streptomyces sp. NBC_01214]|uniref:carbonic anhydrase n=1 Tax=Streptomyces sp. NBC_01214 TaxID=2903777 RepID=UPI002255A65B|nr:carbonic anhydrase [Streptomyces sp. NBC_01214]MCX4808014.1 carbonic anhydrase [Streptomyces sp. NBC_01214]